MNTDAGKVLNLDGARESFLSILRRLENPNVSKDFFSWIQWNWLNRGCQPPPHNLPQDILKSISDFIRENLPQEAVLPSETIIQPVAGKDADCDPHTTLHVDAFLYDEEMVENLCKEGKLDSNYCLNCGSTKTKPLTYISHSASVERILYIFKGLLPPIDNKVVLDIGSRLGPVLYGACLFSQASKVIGVEMNADLCNLQKTVVEKFGFQDRVEVIQADILTQPGIVQLADVIVLNNVFEFFIPYAQISNIWNFLKMNIKSGTLLVTIPSLEETLISHQINFKTTDWVEHIPPYDTDVPGITDISTELEEVFLYQVK